MAYADQGMSRGRITAIVVVGLLHALLGYAFVTGLAYNVVKKVQEDLKTFDVIEEPPPPEEEPPPPPPETPQPVQPPPIVSPPPIVRVNTPPPAITTTRVAPPPVITTTAPPAPPAPVVAPPPPRIVEATKPRADLRGLITGDDYPSSAMRNEEEGTVRVRLTVGPNGRVSDCSVTSSSGSSSLDSATCRLLKSRARFTPAKNNQGQPTTDTYNSPPITWRLQ